MFDLMITVMMKLPVMGAHVMFIHSQFVAAARVFQWTAATVRLQSPRTNTIISVVALIRAEGKFSEFVAPHIWHLPSRHVVSKSVKRHT